MATDAVLAAFRTEIDRCGPEPLAPEEIGWLDEYPRLLSNIGAPADAAAARDAIIDLVRRLGPEVREDVYDNIAGQLLRQASELAQAGLFAEADTRLERAERRHRILFGDGPGRELNGDYRATQSRDSLRRAWEELHEVRWMPTRVEVADGGTVAAELDQVQKRIDRERSKAQEWAQREALSLYDRILFENGPEEGHEILELLGHPVQFSRPVGASASERRLFSVLADLLSRSQVKWVKLTGEHGLMRFERPDDLPILRAFLVASQGGAGTTEGQRSALVSLGWQTSSTSSEALRRDWQESVDLGEVVAEAKAAFELLGGPQEFKWIAGPGARLSSEPEHRPPWPPASIDDGPDGVAWTTDPTRLDSQWGWETLAASPDLKLRLVHVGATRLQPPICKVLRGESIVSETPAGSICCSAVSNSGAYCLVPWGHSFSSDPDEEATHPCSFMSPTGHLLYEATFRGMPTAVTIDDSAEHGFLAVQLYERDHELQCYDLKLPGLKWVRSGPLPITGLEVQDGTLLATLDKRELQLSIDVGTAEDLDPAALAMAVFYYEAFERLTTVVDQVRGMDASTTPADLADWDAECVAVTPAFQGRRPKWEARAWRARGEIAQHCGDRESAIDHYAAALDLDPDVGVKRRLKALRA